jgi:hypothetical protein
LQDCHFGFQSSKGKEKDAFKLVSNDSILEPQHLV